MIRFFFFFLLLIGFYHLEAQEEEPVYFSPKLYETLWPNFCLGHLQRFTSVNNLRDLEPCDFFHSIYLKTGCASDRVDTEMISRLLHDLDWMPGKLRNCEFPFCQNCHEYLP